MYMYRYICMYMYIWTFLVVRMVKHLPVMQETWVQSLDQGDPLVKRIVYPLQYSCLENSMGRGAWQAILSMVSQRVRHD